MLEGANSVMERLLSKRPARSLEFLEFLDFFMDLLTFYYDFIRILIGFYKETKTSSAFLGLPGTSLGLPRTLF